MHYGLELTLEAYQDEDKLVEDMKSGACDAGLIGRAERFPVGVAQILREDFLLKFDNYINRVEVERVNIPQEKWFEVSSEKQQEMANELKELRISLRDQAVYDPDMITLAKRVRCRVASGASECQDNRE